MTKLMCREPKGELKQVKPGTDRAKVLKLMGGRWTTDEIAKKVGRDRRTVLTIVACMHRDCGIGHAYDDEGRISARFPEGASLKEAIRRA